MNPVIVDLAHSCKKHVPGVKSGLRGSSIKPQNVFLFFPEMELNYSENEELAPGFQTTTNSATVVNILYLYYLNYVKLQFLPLLLFNSFLVSSVHFCQSCITQVLCSSHARVIGKDSMKWAYICESHVLIIKYSLSVVVTSEERRS